MDDNLKIEKLKTYFSNEFVEKNSDVFISPNINETYKTSSLIPTNKIHFIHKLVLMLNNDGNDFYDSKYLQEDILQVLKKYIELYPEDCNLQTNDGGTALMYLCLNYNVNEEMISYFANSNLNLQDNHDMTALMYLCLNHNVNEEMISYFANSNLNLQTKSGRTALMYLCLNSNVNDEMISYFANSNLNLQNVLGCTALMFLCLNSRVNINTKMIFYFVNSNLNLQNKISFLHYICCNNKIEILNYVLN